MSRKRKFDEADLTEQYLGYEGDLRDARERAQAEYPTEDEAGVEPWRHWMNDPIWTETQGLYRQGRPPYGQTGKQEEIAGMIGGRQWQWREMSARLKPVIVPGEGEKWVPIEWAPWQMHWYRYGAESVITQGGRSRVVQSLDKDTWAGLSAREKEWYKAGQQEALKAAHFRVRDRPRLWRQQTYPKPWWRRMTSQGQ